MRGRFELVLDFAEATLDSGMRSEDLAYGSGEPSKAEDLDSQARPIVLSVVVRRRWNRAGTQRRMLALPVQLCRCGVHVGPDRVGDATGAALEAERRRSRRLHRRVTRTRGVATTSWPSQQCRHRFGQPCMSKARPITSSGMMAGIANSLALRGAVCPTWTIPHYPADFLATMSAQPAFVDQMAISLWKRPRACVTQSAPRNPV